LFLSLWVAMGLASLSATAHSETLRLVSDTWPPYVYVEDGQTKGVDYEITATIFERLGIDVQWQFLPWKRCLQMIELGQADGILDIFQTPDREHLLLYPAEPLSEVELVLYQDNRRPHRVTQLKDLRGLTIGTSAGYRYGDAFMSEAAIHREPAPSHEANFGKLAKGRVDLVITDRRVGEYTLRRLQLQDTLSQVPGTLERTPQYLALRRNAGMDLLTQRFSAELKRFKQEPAYARLMAKYPLPGVEQAIAAPGHATGQQESSAN